MAQHLMSRVSEGATSAKHKEAPLPADALLHYPEAVRPALGATSVAVPSLARGRRPWWKRSHASLRMTRPHFLSAAPPMHMVVYHTEQPLLCCSTRPCSRRRRSPRAGGSRLPLKPRSSTSAFQRTWLDRGAMSWSRMNLHRELRPVCLRVLSSVWVGNVVRIRITFCKRKNADTFNVLVILNQLTRSGLPPDGRVF